MLSAQKGSGRIEFGLSAWTVVCFDSICAVEWEKKLGVIALNGPLNQVGLDFLRLKQGAERTFNRPTDCPRSILSKHRFTPFFKRPS